MAIAMSETRKNYPLSTKKVLKKTVTGSVLGGTLVLIIYGFAFLFFGTVSAAFGDIFKAAGIGLLSLLLLNIVITYFYQRWYYNVYFYDLTPDYIVIKKGPITPHEITIPYERIQDVYVDQDIFDRLFGLYDVHLSSATASSGEAAHIDGLEKPAADGLRSALLQIVSERISKNKNVPKPA